MLPRFTHRAVSLKTSYSVLVTRESQNIILKSLLPQLSSGDVHFGKRRVHHRHIQTTSVEHSPIKNYLKSNITAATGSPDMKVLTLQFEKEAPLQFPAVWLRDTCRCDACFDHRAQSRLIDQTTFRPDSQPTSLKVEADKLKIEWDDGHLSEYDKTWLCAHSFASSHQAEREPKFHEPRIYWNASKFKKIFQTFNYEDVIKNDETLLKWLVALARYGVAKLDGAPIEDEINHKLTSRVAFIKETLYGTEFQVKSVEGATNTAYKKGQLQLHSDMPFYHYLPGTIFLHCKIQSKEGGDNLLTDGLNAAKQLTPQQYRVLADTVVNWSDIGRDNRHQFHSINREPVLCEDKRGELKKINWSQPQRDPRFDVDIPRAIEWYEAMKAFTNILHHPDNAIILKMQPGDILTIDNRRLLHSRANYSDGARQLNGAYMDWDQIYPRIRILRQQLNILD